MYRERTQAASRLARQLLTAVQSSSCPDPLDDEAVSLVLQSVRTERAAGRVFVALAAAVQHAHLQLRIATVGTADQPSSKLAEIEQAMARLGTIDRDLLRDVFSAIPPAPNHQLRTEQLERVLREWGPYALLTEVYVVLFLVNSAASGCSNRSAEDVLRFWATLDEMTLTWITDD